MPCYDSRDSSENARAEAMREFRHNSPVAEMLCEVMRRISLKGMLYECSPAVVQWWEEHQRRDAAKEAGR